MQSNLKIEHLIIDIYIYKLTQHLSDKNLNIFYIPMKHIRVFISILQSVKLKHTDVTCFVHGHRVSQWQICKRQPRTSSFHSLTLAPGSCSHSNLMDFSGAESWSNLSKIIHSESIKGHEIQIPATSHSLLEESNMHLDSRLSHQPLISKTTLPLHNYITWISFYKGNDFSHPSVLSSHLM